VLPQVDRINRLLDDLLATGRTDGSTLSVKLVPLDLAPLLGQVAERWRADAPSDLIELVVAAALPVLGDQARLEQILDNLIANAVKYSPPGGPILLRGELDAAEVKLRVTDQGGGIPAAEQPFIFDRFYRRPEHRAGRQPGLGLGLYITRELIRSHGGSVSVESEVGRGSTFIVTLPLLAQPLESPKTAEATDQDNRSEQDTVG
jgi:signal transduction histidine kinase